MLREEKQEGLEEGQLMARQESILECLEELGDIPAELQEEIENLEDTGKLKMLLKLAVRADSIADFEKEVLECLEELGDIPAELQEEIENLEDTGKLKMLLKLAVRADSIADFEKEAESYFISEE